MTEWLNDWMIEWLNDKMIELQNDWIRKEKRIVQLLITNIQYTILKINIAKKCQIFNKCAKARQNSEDRESVNEILNRILAKQAAISGGLLLCSKILLKF